MTRITAMMFLTITMLIATAARAQELTPDQQEALRKVMDLPPGTTFEMETSQKTTKDQGSLTKNRTATGKGAGVEGVGDGVNTKVDASAPNVSDDQGGAVAGDTKISTSVEKIFNIRGAFFWTGLFIIIGGGILLAMKRILFGLGCIAAGLLCWLMAISTWFIIPVAVLLLGFGVWEAWLHGYFREGGRSLIAAAKEGNVLPQLESKLSSVMTGTDHAAITTLKKMET